MISAKAIKTKQRSAKAQQARTDAKRWAKEEVQRTKAIARAQKETLPSVLKEVEKAIKLAVKQKQDEAYFAFAPWMSGEYISDDIYQTLKREGYTVEAYSHTPCEGGDPESGEGAYQCGPTEYSCYIRWKAAGGSITYTHR